MSFRPKFQLDLLENLFESCRVISMTKNTLNLRKIYLKNKDSCAKMIKVRAGFDGVES